MQGRIQGWPPVYGLVCYLDPDGRRDYDATALTVFPDRQDRFNILCKNLEAGKSANMKLVACHANGAVTKFQFPFAVAENGNVDVVVMECLFELEDFAKVLAAQGVKAAKQFVPQNKSVSRYAKAVLQGEPKIEKQYGQTL